MLLVPRDSHKSVFDALSVFDLDAVLLPTKTDESFQVSTGVDIPVLKNIVSMSSNKVGSLHDYYLINSQFMSMCCIVFRSGSHSTNVPRIDAQT